MCRLPPPPRTTSNGAAACAIFLLCCCLFPARGEARRLPAGNPKMETTEELVLSRGYEFTAVRVQTDDGYLLELHHVASPNVSRREDRLPVFLQHGLLGSSADWVIQEPSKSLAFSLADEGYAVWMGNFRGNAYSTARRPKHPDSDYWNFSWDEMAAYDLPAAVDRVLQEENRSQLIYIGFSMGTATFWAACQLRPELRTKIRLMGALAPVAYLEHTKSFLIRALAYISKYMAALLTLFGNQEFLPHSAGMKILIHYACTLLRVEDRLCRQVLFLMVGFDSVELDQETFALILATTPSGTSLNTVMHFAQLCNSGGFGMFDFGTEGNLLHYNQRDPPAYNLTTVTVPVVAYHCMNDWLADPKDVYRLKSELGSSVTLKTIARTTCNHVDLMWARDIRELLLDDLLQVVEENAAVIP